jgi:zinc transporter 1
VLFHGICPPQNFGSLTQWFAEHGHGHGHSHSHGDQVVIRDIVESPISDAENVMPIRRSGSIHSLYGLPAQNRVALNQAAQEVYVMSRTSIDGTLDRQERGETNPVIIKPPVPLDSSAPRSHHNHGASSDGALNLRAVFIHVLGDALGSLGVVISGLIIWLTKSQARFYADPALSVAITILIMCSAVPLGTLLCLVVLACRLTQSSSALCRVYSTTRSTVLNLHF